MEFAKAFRVAAFVSLAVAFVLQSNSPTNAQERVSWKMQRVTRSHNLQKIEPNGAVKGFRSCGLSISGMHRANIGGPKAQ